MAVTAFTFLVSLLRFSSGREFCKSTFCWNISKSNLSSMTSFPMAASSIPPLSTRSNILESKLVRDNRTNQNTTRESKLVSQQGSTSSYDRVVAAVSENGYYAGWCVCYLSLPNVAQPTDEKTMGDQYIAAATLEPKNQQQQPSISGAIVVKNKEPRQTEEERGWSAKERTPARSI